LRIPAAGDRRGRLTKLVAFPVLGLLLAACTQQANNNPTGDSSAPNLFGETSTGLGFPHEVVTTEGIASAGLYLPVFLIAVAIFILVEGLLLFLVLRFRKRSSGTDLPAQTHGNNVLELIWTAIPMVIVFVLFLVSTNVLVNDVEATSEDHGAVVNVEAFRFGWIFEYQQPGTLDPESGDYASANVTISGGGREAAPEMVLPVGEPVLIRLTAADVIHSWYVPSFFFKRDAIPGRINEFELTIEKPGVYGGQCAEFCGLAHGDMYFSVNAVAPAEYDAWLAETSGASTGGVDPGADAETEAAGEEEGGTITDPDQPEESETTEEAA
jgi:cytochrome c oxidase subunit 2